MAARRAVGVMVAVVAIGALLAVRAARAQDGEAPVVVPAEAEPAKPAVVGRSQLPAPMPSALTPAATVRRSPPAATPVAYAAEAAASSSRLPPEERAARLFLRTVVLRQQVEMEASRIAITLGHSAAVRSFAVDLLQAHQATEPELVRLLQVREMAPPPMDLAQRKALQRLARQTGAKFDRDYLDLVGERNEVEFHARALQAIGDPVLRGWIERQLPTLREQQAMAERLGPGRRTDVARR